MKSLYLIITVLLFWSHVVYSQICNGSFGDPVVNLTFGQGPSGPSPYVPATSYGFAGTDCPHDGNYTIIDHTSNCFGGNWFTFNSDHTGNGGNFMLVNASYQSGDFFLDTVTNLCPNTTYEFSAWIMNVCHTSNSIRPNITFHIEKPDGSNLDSFNTGDVPITTLPQWNQYGTLFITPLNNPVIVLRITNNAPGGNGNDLALDDISFRPCGAKVTAIVQGNSDTIQECEGDQVPYTLTGSASSSYQSPVYQWQVSADSGTTWHNVDGATSVNYQYMPGAAGNYWYRFTVVDASVAGNTSCVISSNLLIAHIHPKPVVNAGPDRVYIKGYNAVVLDATATGENISFSWSPSLYMNDPHSIDPVVTPPNDITYTLSAQSSFGCTNSDNVQVKFTSGIFIPGAFTPNGDGKNDRWRIPSLDIGLDAEVNVFNRWGQLVYRSYAAEVSWDGTIQGKPQPAGVYVYVINFKSKYHPIRGTVTLIR